MSPERQYSSSDDPYTQLTYSDLSEELKLVNEQSAWNSSANYCCCWGESTESMVVMLILLLYLWVPTVDLQSNSWECTAHHKYVCKQCQFRGYTYVCTIIAEITGTHHIPMLLDLPSTILSIRQFHFQDWGFSSFYDFVNLLA